MTPYTHPPVSTNSAIRDRSRDCRNLRQSMAICYILPCSAIFCLPVSTATSAISATSMTVTGHPRDTLYTSTYFHRLSNQRPITRLPQSTAIYGNLPYSAMFYHILPTCFYCNIYNIRNVHNFCQILPSLLNSAKFCQNYNLKPILFCIRVN